MIMIERTMCSEEPGLHHRDLEIFLQAFDLLLHLLHDGKTALETSNVISTTSSADNDDHDDNDDFFGLHG